MLTMEQKQLFVDKFGKQCARLPAEIIRNQHRLENEGKGAFSLFVDDLKKVDILAHSLKQATQATQARPQTTRSSLSTVSKSSSDLLKLSCEFKSQIIRDQQEQKKGFFGFFAKKEKQPSPKTPERTNSQINIQRNSMSLSLSLNSQSISASSKEPAFKEMTLTQGYHEVTQLLQEMVAFFKKVIAKMDPLKFTFQSDQQPELVQRLKTVRLRSDKLRQTRFDCHKQGLSQEENEVLKQAFWLNLINFLTLYKLAEISLVQPGILKRMDSFAMWHTFWETTTVYISKLKVSLSTIIFSFLRQHQQLPQFSVILPEKQQSALFDSDIRPLIVEHPEPFNFYGVFIPCPQFQHLQVFDASPAAFRQQLVSAIVRIND